MPGIKLVDVNLSNDGDWDGEGGDFLCEVVKDEFFISRVEPEARR